jgi:hypothetical protein
MGMPTIQLHPSDAEYIKNSNADAVCKPRILIERVIMRRTVEALLAAGFYITVDNEGMRGNSDDPDDYAIVSSRDLDKIMAEVQAVDDEYLLVSRNPDLFDPAKRADAEFAFDSYVYFVYGNDGWDVINDYQTDLEDVLKPINDFSDTLEDGALFVLSNDTVLGESLAGATCSARSTTSSTKRTRTTRTANCRAPTLSSACASSSLASAPRWACSRCRPPRPSLPRPPGKATWVRRTRSSATGTTAPRSFTTPGLAVRYPASRPKTRPDFASPA